MRTIELMADYDCFPLWESSPGLMGNVDPEDLPISPELRGALDRWAQEFDATLDRENPAQSGFSSEDAEARFRTRGRELGERLKTELGKDFTVVVRV